MVILSDCERNLSLATSLYAIEQNLLELLGIFFCMKKIKTFLKSHILIFK